MPVGYKLGRKLFVFSTIYCRLQSGKCFTQRLKWKCAAGEGSGRDAVGLGVKGKSNGEEVSLSPFDYTGSLGASWDPSGVRGKAPAEIN